MIKHRSLKYGIGGYAGIIGLRAFSTLYSTMGTATPNCGLRPC